MKILFDNRRSGFSELANPLHLAPAQEVSGLLAHMPTACFGYGY
jgi:hypothetical protein